MSKSLKSLGIALILTVAVSMMAADASYPNVGKVWNITFTTAMKVGNTLLPAGDYLVQHVTNGDQHLLVFKTTNHQEKVRVNCRLEALSGKADHTTKIFRPDAAGESVLESVEFSGDRFRHELVNQSTASAP